MGDIRAALATDFLDPDTFGRAVTNTILHDTRTPLVSWFFVMYLCATTRHGVSGKELQRQLGVKYKTAYRL